MGLWYTSSNDRCRCCCCTCCCHCRPKRTLPTFVGTFTLLGSAIVLALMLTGRLSVGYFAVPIFGFAASFSLLCYVAGIIKYTVRPQQSSSLQQIRPQSGGNPGVNARITNGLRTHQAQLAAAANGGATSQNNATSSTAAAPATVQLRARPSTTDRTATLAANTAQHHNAGASTSVLSSASVGAVSASRTSASTRTRSLENGLVSEGRDRARPTLNLSHGLVDERRAPNSDAPPYFDVVVTPPSRPPADGSSLTAMQASRSGMTQTWTRRQPVLDERERSSAQEIPLEPLPTYDSIFPSGTVFLAAEP